MWEGTEGPARGRGWWGARLAVSSVLVGRLTKLDETADGREVRRSLTATAGRPPPLTGGLSYQTYDTRYNVSIQRHQRSTTNNAAVRDSRAAHPNPITLVRPAPGEEKCTFGILGEGGGRPLGGDFRRSSRNLCTGRMRLGWNFVVFDAAYVLIPMPADAALAVSGSSCAVRNMVRPTAHGARVAS